MQHQDIYPALMVAGDQVGVLIVQALQPFDLPLGVAQQVHPDLVAADPGFVDEIHQPAAQALRGGEGQADLQQGHAEQRNAAGQGVQRQQGGADQAA